MQALVVALAAAGRLVVGAGQAPVLAAEQVPVSGVVARACSHPTHKAGCWFFW